MRLRKGVEIGMQAATGMGMGFGIGFWDGIEDGDEDSWRKNPMHPPPSKSHSPEYAFVAWQIAVSHVAGEMTNGRFAGAGETAIWRFA